MNGDDNQLIRRHMTTLFEFARAMQASIQNINENSYNNFTTRIGMWPTYSFYSNVCSAIHNYINLTNKN